ncbi:acyl-CoA dehydrogenase family protein [Streptomyces sp. NPDC101152]|uniref:acyl-CoA dehydrogenase family protein n=1 Tax=Streptomyces sp. NPDC101152 TaxID=3366116 RepID=UPI00382153F4
MTTTVTPDTAGSLVSRAQEVERLAARHAAEADRDRHLRAEVVEAIADAGFTRHFVPARWGGAAGGFGALVDAVTVVGEGCTAAAWVASLGATVARMAAHLPAEGQQEIWGDGPDPLLVGALMPVGRARPVPGGWRLTGTWSFISAVDHSDWALVCAMTPAEGAHQEEARYFAVERAAYTVRDTWLSVGMRGTGSNTLVLEEVFVPVHRSFPREHVLEGTGSPSPAPCHRVPLKAVNGLSFVTPILGATRGMFARWTEWGAARETDVAFREVLTRTAWDLDTALLLLHRAASVADGGAPTALLTARSARDCALVAERLLTATNLMFRATGTSGQSQGSPFERSWRDVNSASSHLVLRLGPAAAAYTEQLLAEPKDVKDSRRT